VPLLGVCLGHQALIEAWGGIVGPAGAILHGRSSRLIHQGDPLFEGISSPATVGRYHSLAGHDLPADLEAVAWTGDIVMAVRHRRCPQIGIQFHPESILTPQGGRLIENVIGWARGGA
jgi:anthranilate synthase/aminodeoxychorismate synthase-like glutamine amidotransferase